MLAAKSPHTGWRKAPEVHFTRPYVQPLLCAIANGMAVGSLRWETPTAGPRASYIKPRIALWLYLGAAFVFVRIVTQEAAGGGMQALGDIPPALLYG